MTRFARSKGSTGSGSNPKRVEEDATPWQQMARAVRLQNQDLIKENFEEIEDDEDFNGNQASQGNVETFFSSKWTQEIFFAGKGTLFEFSTQNNAFELLGCVSQHSNNGLENDEDGALVADILVENEEKDEEKDKEKAEKEGKSKKLSRRERTKDKCLNCKEKGHQKRDCPQLPEERRKELQDLFEMKVTRKGQGTGRKKNKKRKAGDLEKGEEEAKGQEAEASKPKRSKPLKITKDKTGQVGQYLCHYVT